MAVMVSIHSIQGDPSVNSLPRQSADFIATIHHQIDYL
jgi:hypothetical protein